LAVYLKGVTREADETEEQFKFRKMLAKSVTDLQRLLENLEFLQNSMPSGQVLQLKEKLCKEITQILTQQASCDQRHESSADLEYDD
jgi:hypothetical protein